MIRVLVVDDDKLVRKGLISAMPWQEFQMQVIGEASNGGKALEFLAEHEVDLLLTDLSMPVMSGIELMRIVRKQYPHVHIAVLTLHQDFEYIQEAMRLGAIDYIAKVQLEKERFEEVLGRIYNRIMEEDQLKGISNREIHEDEVFTIHEGYVLLSMNRVSGGSLVRNWVSGYSRDLVELGLNLFFYIPAAGPEGERVLENLLMEIEGSSDWVMIKLRGIKDLATRNVYGWIREYKETHFFYDYHPSRKVINKTILTADIAEQEEQELTEDDLNTLKNHWHSLEWIYQDALYQKYLEELRLHRLSQAKLIGFLYVLVDRWNHLFVKIGPVSVQLHDSIDSWQEAEEWLTNTRNQIRQVLGKAEFSPEVIKCIMKAVVFLHDELDQQITATDIAKRVNMSRSYFSQCFKEIVGENFNHYLRQVRIEKAKHYLLCTNKTILWIANNVGYEDDKYFSRSFREQTGMLPSEYRARVQQGRELSVN